MVYNVIVSPRALNEIEAAIDFYVLNSNDAPKNFITELADAYEVLARNPFKRIRYKNIRAIQLNKFPYFLFYVVNKSSNTVRVLSCFHNKRNPENRPNY